MSKQSKSFQIGRDSSYRAVDAGEGCPPQPGPYAGRTDAQEGIRRFAEEEVTRC
jgi:hypothetical protein